MATKTIKVTDNRQGRSLRTGVNGRYYDLPLNQTISVDAALADHLTSIGVAFDEVDTKGASASKEGSVDILAPAPTGEHDVRAPAMDAKSVGDRPLAGDQPGDVTASGGVRFADEAHHGSTIESDAKVSDLRVAAERQADKDASVAERAGEGEGGTEKAAAPAPAPHKAKK